LYSWMNSWRLTRFCLLANLVVVLVLRITLYNSSIFSMIFNDFQ
jgi:hypothetical protein